MERRLGIGDQFKVQGSVERNLQEAAEAGVTQDATKAIHKAITTSTYSLEFLETASR
jgi:hypothetical protein